MANKIKVLLTGAGSTLGREILAQLLTMRKVFEISVLDIKRGHTMAFFERSRFIFSTGTVPYRIIPSRPVRDRIL